MNHRRNIMLRKCNYFSLSMWFIVDFEGEGKIESKREKVLRSLHSISIPFQRNLNFLTYRGSACSRFFKYMKRK